MFGNVEHSTNNYIKYLTETIGECKDEDVKEKLQRAKHLIDSRIKLQKAFAYNLKSSGSIIDTFEECEIDPIDEKLSDCFKLFKSYMESIHTYSKNKNIPLRIINKLDSENKDYIITSYEGVIEEILFEIASNIESHSLTEIEIKNKGIEEPNVIFSLEEFKNMYYLAVENNIAPSKKTKKVNQHLISNNNQHGLCIIDKYSKYINDRGVRVKYSKTKNTINFKISVPVKIKKNKKNEKKRKK